MVIIPRIFRGFEGNFALTESDFAFFDPAVSWNIPFTLVRLIAQVIDHFEWNIFCNPHRVDGVYWPVPWFSGFTDRNSVDPFLSKNDPLSDICWYQARFRALVTSSSDRVFPLHEDPAGFLREAFSLPGRVSCPCRPCEPVCIWDPAGLTAALSRTSLSIRYPYWYVHSFRDICITVR